MYQTTSLPVRSIYQHLDNLRTSPQADEISAISALIAVNPEWFYALMESIIVDGYLPLENILVIQKSKTKYEVREGNRRIAILKILHGHVKPEDFEIPDALLEKINLITPSWKKANDEVPCLVYDSSKIATVDRIVARVHGKGEKSGRLKWGSVATAREARDIGKKPQPGLDLLEKYLSKGKNLTQKQKERWAGDYHVTVLDEFLTKLLPRTSFSNVSEIVSKYPSLAFRSELEEVMHAIGTETVGFKSIRADVEGTFSKYGLPPLPGSTTPTPGGAAKGGSIPPKSGKPPAPKKGAASFSSTDPRRIKKLLKEFSPTGKNDRTKVVDLKDEASSIKLEDTPLAFCYLLRSMFEISAELYCKDHDISRFTKKIGKDGKPKEKEKSLSSLLTEIVKHILDNSTEKGLDKKLHGANTELAKPEGMLSVTSMNQLVHNDDFSVSPADICRVFGRIFPLLEKMNH